MVHPLLNLTHSTLDHEPTNLFIHFEEPRTTPTWSMTHFDVFLKVNSPRVVGKLTSKVNSRSEYATKTLLAVQGD